MNKLINVKSALIIARLIIGIVVGVILIKKPQILKSRASAHFDYANALQVTDENNQPLKMIAEGQYEYTSTKVRISVKDPNKFTAFRDTPIDQQLDTHPIKITPFGHGNVDTVTNNIPPMSTIPEACKYLGPSPLVNLAGISPTIIEDQTNFEKQYGPNIIHGALPIIGMGKWFGNSYLEFRYTDKTSYPLSWAGDDIRWAARVISIGYALNAGDYAKYWYGRANGGLDLADGCINIKKAEEKLLLENKWVPSYDELEQQAAKLIGLEWSIENTFPGIIQQP